MGFDFLSRAAKFLQEQKEYKRWLAAFLCLAIVVVFGITLFLRKKKKNDAYIKEADAE